MRLLQEVPLSFALFEQHSIKEQTSFELAVHQRLLKESGGSGEHSNSKFESKL